jgi:4-amino-4-deoxy-L-arabinose transferase-like glycosyltransferase
LFSNQPAGERTHFILLAALSFLILFVPLHRGDLSGYDDALYAHEAKEMLRSGDWWNVRFNGSLNFEYPPMFIWLEAVSFSLLGFSDFAAKAPAALAGFGTIVLVYFLARELTNDPWIARLAMFVLVSTQFFMRYATHAMTDVPFTFFFALAVLLYVKGLRNAKYFVWAGLPIACGLLTRSVIGLIPIAVILVHVLVTRRFAFLLSRHWIGFLLLALGPPVLWFAVEYRLHGPAFLLGHASFVASKAQGASPFSISHELMQLIEYPRLLAQRYWPWLPVMALGLYRNARTALFRRDSTAVFLTAWIFCVVGAFALADTKVLRYILPAFPAFSIVSAMVLDGWLTAARKEAAFKVLYALASVFVIYAAFVPMTLLRATDMRALGPVAEAHTAPQERVLLYSRTGPPWDRRNQFLWYANRSVDVATSESELDAKLTSAGSVVALVDRQTAGELLAVPREGKGARVELLGESEEFVCLKYTRAGT